MGTNINLLGPLKAAFDAIVNLGRTLTQVGPFFRVLEETMLVCLFRSPDDTGGCACGVETSVRLVAFVRLAELSVNGGAKFWWLSVAVTCACAAGMGDLIRVYGGPWLGNEGQGTAQGFGKTQWELYTPRCRAHSEFKSLNRSPSFPRSTSLCIGKLPIARADVRPDHDVWPPPADSKEMIGLTTYHSRSGPLSSRSVAGRRLPSSG